MTFPTLSRRIFTAAVLCSAAFTAGAQDKYPSKPITVVVPQAAGGATTPLRAWWRKNSANNWARA